MVLQSNVHPSQWIRINLHWYHTKHFLFLYQGPYTIKATLQLLNLSILSFRERIAPFHLASYKIYRCSFRHKYKSLNNPSSNISRCESVIRVIAEFVPQVLPLSCEMKAIICTGEIIRRLSIYSITGTCDHSIIFSLPRIALISS